MGNCLKRPRREDIELTNMADIPSSVKNGQPYADIRGTLKSFDLLLFKGGDFISDLIRFVERRILRDGSSVSELGYPIDAGSFSHVGMVVKSDILNHPLVKEGEVYVWESTMSGFLSDGVPNIDGVGFFGTQLRNLDLVLTAYDAPDDTAVAVSPLNRTLLAEKWSDQGLGALKIAFTQLFNELNGIHYDANLYSLFASGFKCLRPERDAVEEVAHTEKWLFCSELIAMVYQEIGVFPASVNPKNVLPMDFLGYDMDVIAEGGVPVVVGKPEYMISDQHLPPDLPSEEEN